MNKHTPGPWEVYTPDDVDTKTYGIDGADGSAVVYFGFDPSEGIQEIANARLIAAAPDLLEALKAMISTFAESPCSACSGDCSTANPPVSFCPFDAVKSARTAITKATGA